MWPQASGAAHGQWGEFTDAEVAYSADNGIQRHFSARYTPWQNGVVERRNQTVVATARALLKQRMMSVIYWGEAVMAVVHLLNRSPNQEPQRQDAI